MPCDHVAAARLPARLMRKPPLPRPARDLLSHPLLVAHCDPTRLAALVDAVADSRPLVDNRLLTTRLESRSQAAEGPSESGKTFSPAARRDMPVVRPRELDPALSPAPSSCYPSLPLPSPAASWAGPGSPPPRAPGTWPCRPPASPATPPALPGPGFGSLASTSPRSSPSATSPRATASMALPQPPAEDVRRLRTRRCGGVRAAPRPLGRPGKPRLPLRACRRSICDDA